MFLYGDISSNNFHEKKIEKNNEKHNMLRNIEISHNYNVSLDLGR